MQLNKLIIETRVRSAWSSIDLGFTVAKLFWLRGFVLYLVLAVPVSLLLTFAIGTNSFFNIMILWWCKPFFERPMLFILSRELFSERMSLMQTLGYFKSWAFPSLIWILTLRRISLVRGMLAPISLLEQPTSTAYNQRAQVLGSKYSSEASWLNIVMYHVEAFFYMGVLALAVIFFPQLSEPVLAFFTESDVSTFYSDAIYLLIMATIAPFYCAAGFMLYISRRVELEGWDIEICFREWIAEQKGGETESLVNDEHA